MNPIERNVACFIGFILILALAIIAVVWPAVDPCIYNGGDCKRPTPTISIHDLEVRNTTHKEVFLDLFTSTGSLALVIPGGESRLFKIPEGNYHYLLRFHPVSSCDSTGDLNLFEDFSIEVDSFDKVCALIAK